MTWPFVVALPTIAAASLKGLVSSYPRIAGYVIGSTVYEGFRTLPRVRSAKWHRKSFRHGYDGPDVPLLVTEKIAAGCFCALQGIIVAPIHIVEDAKRFEMTVRRLNPLQYGYTIEQLNGGDSYMSYLDIVTESPRNDSTGSKDRSQ